MLSQVGVPAMLGLYLAGGLTANLSQTIVHQFQHQNRRTFPFDADAKRSMGASGALNAILTQYAFSNPRSTILLFGVVPGPALLW